MQKKIIDLSKTHPRNNLPSKSSKKRKESLLTTKFLFSLNKQLTQEKRNFILTKELNLNGYGIADVILFEYRNPTKIKALRLKRPAITCFEIKIKDWRKALRQGFRYKYYSNKAIVVLPEENTDAAIKSISNFKMLQVGLWSLSKDNIIKKHYTPRIRKPINNDAKKKAITVLQEKLSNLR